MQPIIFVLLALVGKTNVGKSTFFSASTMIDVEISNRIFTTIQPNKGTVYVKSNCPCKTLKITCNPNNSKCENGTRLIPFQLMDIAGLVPGAHLGKGLGNQFLDDIRQANAMIHVVDAAGSTTENGESTAPGTRNPIDDIIFLENEIDLWIQSIIEKGIKKGRSAEQGITEQLTGLSISPEKIKQAIDSVGVTNKLAKEIRKLSKPMIIAANRMDLPNSNENLKQIKEQFPDKIIVPTCAEAELALRRANRAGIIKYTPGASDFEILNANEQQETALQSIKSLLKKYGSTGVQECIDRAVFDLLGMVVVYPVEDENKFCNRQGAVLPDAFLLKQGSTTQDLAYSIHTDIGKKLICGIDAKTKKRLAKDYVVNNEDVIKLVV